MVMLLQSINHVFYVIKIKNNLLIAIKFVNNVIVAVKLVMVKKKQIVMNVKLHYSRKITIIYAPVRSRIALNVT